MGNLLYGYKRVITLYICSCFYSAFFSCIYVIMPTNCRLSSLVVVIRIFTVTEAVLLVCY